LLKKVLYFIVGRGNEKLTTDPSGGNRRTRCVVHHHMSSFLCGYFMKAKFHATLNRPFLFLVYLMKAMFQASV